MHSVEEESSEVNMEHEGLCDDDFDCNNPSVQVGEEVPQLEKPKMQLSPLEKLPMELLRMIIEELGMEERVSAARCSRKMAEAVASSKWNSFGDGQLVVTFAEKLEECSIDFGAFPKFQVKRNMDSYGIQGVREERRTDRETIGAREIKYLRRLCKKLHVEELRLESVSIDHIDLQLFNEFLDSSCTFDKMSIVLNKRGQLKERMHALMARAKKEVWIEMEKMVLTHEEMLSIQRPVAFRVDRAWQEYTILPEDLFVNLVRTGHSLLGFTTAFSSLEALDNVVETVSSSPIHQTVDMPGLDRKLVDRYVKKVGAVLDPKLAPLLAIWRAKYSNPERLVTISPEKFVHRGALISQERENESKIVVESKNYTTRPFHRQGWPKFPKGQPTGCAIS